ncbi:MAG: hypothetical protein M3Q64_00975 [bacterium]|nr:hypothetical protein [bacterium]
MALQKNILYLIENGPSKFDWVNHFHEITVRKHKALTITVRPKNVQGSLAKHTLKLFCTVMAHEDGSLNSYLFKGTLITLDEQRICVDGYYSTNGRNGWIKVIDSVGWY